MPVPPAKTKKTSSQTKSENCGHTTATTNTTDGRLTLPQSENTSQGRSTSSPKHGTPYWTPDCLELSQKLLSLTATPHAGGDLNLWMTWQSNTTLDAWFSTHLHIVRENGRWFVIVPQPRQVVKPESQRQPIVALDPGVKSDFAVDVVWMWIEITKVLAGSSCGLCRLRPPILRRFA